MTSDRKFAVFILSHGRPSNVKTYHTLRTAGYTGKIYIIVDDCDKTLSEYKENFKENLIIFSKSDARETTETCDNFGKNNVVVFARNANFNIARGLGLTHFLQLDDDYSSFAYRRDSVLNYAWVPSKNLDLAFEAVFDFLDCTPFISVALSQGGDHIGGANSTPNNKGPTIRRKLMNAFFCSMDKPFAFHGTLNEDVNFYSEEQRRGVPCGTLLQLCLTQSQTQAQGGGLTDAYLDSGTYVKSFYSVIVCPSGVSISALAGNYIGHMQHWRIHHRVSSDAVAPKIIPQSAKKSLARIAPITFNIEGHFP